MQDAAFDERREDEGGCAAVEFPQRQTTNGTYLRGPSG
jgi:hypothetical protein